MLYYMCVQAYVYDGIVISCTSLMWAPRNAAEPCSATADDSSSWQIVPDQRDVSSFVRFGATAACSLL